MFRYFVFCSLCLLVVAGCATKPVDSDDAAQAYEENNDPLEPVNRLMFGFNQGLDKFAIKPTAQGYRFVTPASARRGFYNFFENLRQPLYAINAGLQGEGKRSVTILRRFGTNVLFGFFGFGDTASAEDVPVYLNDFGQTLYVWGVKQGGPYLVLPFYGPSNVRDAVGLIGDGFLNPADWAFRHEPFLLYGRPLAGGIVRRERALEALDSLEKSSTDYYATLRSMIAQNRQKELNDSVSTPENVKQDYEFDFPTYDEE